MSTTPNGNIDVDALIHTLLHEKSGDEAQPSTPKEPAVAPQPEEKPVPVSETAEEPTQPAPAPKKAKEKKESPRRSLFGKKQAEEETEDDAFLGLKPIGHYRVEESTETDEAKTEMAKPDAEVPQEKKPGNDEFPAVRPVAETITMQVVLPSGEALPRAEQKTRVIPAVKTEEPSPAPAAEPVIEEKQQNDQLPDQLSLEEMVRVEDMEEQPVPAEDDVTPEERYEQSRREKVREFTLKGEEEFNDPEEEVSAEEPEPEAIEEFADYTDARAVQMELQRQVHMATFTMVASLVLELLLLLLTLLTVGMGQSPITDAGYLTVHTFSLVALIGLQYSTVLNGLSGLFTLKANGDTPPAIAAVVALVSVLLHFFDAATLPYWGPIAGLLLVFSAVSRLARARCVRQNFAFVSYAGDKYSAALIQEGPALREIGRRVVGDGDTATVTYFRRTAFLSDYLANANEEDISDDWSRWLAPVATVLSLLLSAVFALLGQVEGFFGWLELFTALVCLTMPCTRLAVQMQLGKCCRYMLSRGGFLVGWKAVRDLGTPDALVVDVADLYPDESMLLHGIKTFAGSHIDDAILDAASLAVRSGGPLAMIFRRIIQDKEELLHEVDSLVYEQGMGLSGWVDGRRVLVGNRRLLQNHDVDVPSSDYEARYAKDGRRLVYLSTAGELSAMFVVSYLADPEIESALRSLCRAKVTLLVRSCDPNLTVEDLCDGFDLDEYYVDILPAAAGRRYMQLVHEGESESTPAVMASNGHILGTARLMSVCRSLRLKSVIALAVQSLAAVIGLLLGIVWTVNSAVPLYLPLLFILLTTAVTLLAPLFRRM